MAGHPELQRWRADTEGVANVIHLNNAGAALPPRAVVDAVVAHLRLEAAIGGYEAADAQAAAVTAVRASVARLLGAAPEEIALVEHATRAWELAFWSVPFKRGDVIVTGVAEYASNYLSLLKVREQHGVEIVVCPDDETGALDVAALGRILAAGRTRMVAMTHVPTNGGLVNPASAVGTLARAHGALFLLDACQSVGQLAIDVEAIGCDFLSATGRKYLRGPRGTGFLYARAATTAALEPAVLDLHSATWLAGDRYDLAAGARRYESWESSVAGRLGLGAAVDYALAIGLGPIEERIRALGEGLRGRLASIPGITIRDKGRDRCGIVTFTHDRITPEAMRAGLRSAGINTTVSGRTSTRLDMDARGLEAVSRASVHYYNSEEELDRAVEVLGRLVARGPDA